MSAQGSYDWLTRHSGEVWACAVLGKCSLSRTVAKKRRAVIGCGSLLGGCALRWAVGKTLDRRLTPNYGRGKLTAQLIHRHHLSPSAFLCLRVSSSSSPSPSPSSTTTTQQQTRTNYLQTPAIVNYRYLFPSPRQLLSPSVLSSYRFLPKRAVLVVLTLFAHSLTLVRLRCHISAAGVRDRIALGGIA